MAGDAELGACAAAQLGMFSRAQAVAAGFRAGQIERRVRAGVWRQVYPRVYRHVTVPESTASRYWAAVLWCGPPCALSHASAAAIWRLDDAPTGVDTDVVVPRSRAPRVAGVAVHRVVCLDPRDVVSQRGLPVTDPVRTVIDLAGMLSSDDLERVLIRALSARLLTVRAVLGRLDEIGSSGRAGVSLLRTLLAPIGSSRVDRSARMAG
jgi:hypothetical protein